MNELSWLIYFADVAPSFSSALAWTGSLLCLTFFALHLFSYDETAFKKEEDQLSFRRSTRIWPMFGLMWFMSFAVPSNSNTYYAIAASETGEQALKSPIAQKTFKALENWLDKQLKEEKPSNATG